MARDIHLHVEYYRRKKGKKPRWVHSENNFINDRLYFVFSIIGMGGDINPLFPLRGLPGDLTLETYNDYKQWGGEALDVSWLTSHEFGKCLDTIDRIVKEECSYVDNDWLENYIYIYKCMKESEDEGEPARIIFWFDN